MQKKKTRAELPGYQIGIARQLAYATVFLASAILAITLFTIGPAFAETGLTAAETQGSSTGTLLKTQAANTFADANGRNWMSKLPDNIPVSSISIPGTHDSATMWTKLPSTMSAVQDQTIGEWEYTYVNLFGKESTEHFDGQLNCGVRYFDLRLSVKTEEDSKEHAGELYLLHGFHFNEAQLCVGNQPIYPGEYKTLYLDGDGKDDNGDGLDDGVWQWFEDFLSKNPTETLIVEFADEADGKKAEVYENFKNKALEKYSRVWKGDHAPTLGEARGKIILFANLGGSYDLDKFKLDDGTYWALPVRWGPGSKNGGVEQCGDGDNYELWGQNTYEGIYSTTKQDYVFNAIAFKDEENGGMYARSAVIRDTAIRNGKNAWIVNFTSGNSPFKGGLISLVTPRDYYSQTIKHGLRKVDWFQDDYLQGYWQKESKTGIFTGILAMDFVDADLARFIYRVNFYSYAPPEYTWTFTDDLSDPRQTKCKATRYVMGDRSISQTVEQDGLSEFEYTTERTCTKPGTIKYKARFPQDKSWAFPATTTQTVPALGHRFEYVNGTAANTITYKCNRCDERVTLTLNAKSIEYDEDSYKPRYECTLGNVDAFNKAMGTSLSANNIKLYKNGAQVAEARDAGTYTARIYVDETHYAECPFEITPAKVEVTLDDFKKEYGQPDPEFTFSARPSEAQSSIKITREAGENVGTYKLSASVADNPNYTVTTKPSIHWEGKSYPQLSIEKRRVKVSGITAQDKVYDGTTVATPKYDNVKFSYKDTGAQFTDANLSVSAQCSFVHARVSDNAQVDVIASETKLVGLNANSYIIEKPNSDINQSGYAKISKRPVKVWALAQSVEEGASIQDGKLYAVAMPTEASESGLAEGHELASVNLSADKPTANEITSITPSSAIIRNGSEVSAEDVTQNYNIEYGEGAAYVKSMESTVPVVKNLVYNGADQELVTCSNNDVRYSLDREIWSSAIPKAKNAGTYTVYWRIGDDSSSAIASVAATIARKPVKVVPENGLSKTYGDPDPTRTVKVHEAALDTQLIAGHKLTDVSRMPGEDAGTYGYDVSSIRVLDGKNGDADMTGNYDISFYQEQTERRFTIEPRPVTVSGITVEAKVYDGTTAAVVDTSTAAISNVLENDRITVSATAKFGDKAAGENKPVTISDLALVGQSASNYKLAAAGQQDQATATIVPKPTSVSGIVVGNGGSKVYDGLTTIGLNTSNITFSGKVDGDDLSVSDTGTLMNPNVGTDRNVAIRLTGNDAANYELIVTGPNTRYTANVTPCPIKVSGITAASKTYDGTVETKLNATGMTLVPVGTVAEGADMVTAIASGSFADADAGENKTVNINLELDGVGADNFTLAPDSQKTTTASIHKRPLSVKANDQVIDWGKEIAKDPGNVIVKQKEDESGAPLEGTGLADGHYLGAITLTADETAKTISAAGARIYASDDGSDTPRDCASNYDITYQEGTLTVTRFAERPEGLYWEYDGAEHALVEGGSTPTGYKLQYHVEALGKPDSADADDAETPSSDALSGEPITEEKWAEWARSVDWQDGSPHAKESGLYCIVYRSIDESGSAPTISDYDYTLAYIAPKRVSVEWSGSSFTYNGDPQAPTARIVGLIGSDASAATVTGAQVNAGTYTATARVPLSSNYELATASNTKAFTISPADISTASVTLSQDSYVYSGTAYKPTPTVTIAGRKLVAGSDYLVSYANNVNAGKATATIAGKGNYKGSVRKAFTIKKAKSSVSIKAQSKTYTGAAQAYTGKVARSGSKGSVKVSFFQDKACKKGVTPKHVGTYYARATLAPDGNHLGATSAAVKFSIKVPNAPLLLKMVAKGKNGLEISWNKYVGADGYDLYLSKCGRGMTFKKVATVKSGKKLKLTKRGLKKNTSYKAYVKAYVMIGGKKSYLKTSAIMHAYTTGGNNLFTNPESVTVKKSKASLKVGKTYKIKANVVKLYKSKALISEAHAKKLRYLSSNPKIATVSKSGKVTAKRKGSCKIYAYAANGVRKAVSITVS